MFRMKFRLLFVCTLLTVCGCESRSDADRGKLHVVVTTSILGDAVRQIGGDAVSLTVLMPPGTDPHSYAPVSSDAVALDRADLILCHGLHLEGKMVDLLEKRNAVAVGNRLDRVKIRRVDGDTADDPHVWFDVALWSQCIEVVIEELIRFDPVHAAEYRMRGDSYRGELAVLDTQVRSKIAGIPPADRVLVTSHDAFGYFASAYGVEVKGLQGVSTSSAIGTKDLDDLAEYLGRKKVRAIFTETSTPTKGLGKVLEITRSRFPTAPPIALVAGDEALYSDSLGAVGTATGTYVGTVTHNVDVLVKYLKP